MQNDQVGPETEDDVKRKFREALERKKQTGQERRAHEENRSKINGTRRSADRKRNFRRKAG
ncbi:hypothetical protein F0L17_01275 [Streptomyces sp. TRM43335]|uniref:DUF5302 domain-containing protein n=1 Tax=Streptomyces taklimakanensis TaxID=2569853 RepID=A0A6G2B686_9ACTN|nr:DUF5302 domain-containing protein [Streptomyces taklimakanensis]MTE17785.1 hypothetical protein [Streptomyces taklimakanensis]